MGKYDYLVEAIELWLEERTETEGFHVKMIGDSLNLSPSERNQVSQICHKWLKQGKLTKHGKFGASNIYRKVAPVKTPMDEKREAEARRRIALDEAETVLCQNCKSEFTAAELGESFLALLSISMRIADRFKSAKEKVVKDHNELVNENHELRKHIDEQSKKILKLNQELAAGAKKSFNLHEMQSEFEKLAKD